MLRTHIKYYHDLVPTRRRVRLDLIWSYLLYLYLLWLWMHWNLFLKALLTIALSSSLSPIWEGPLKVNMSMVRRVGWAWHRRLHTDRHTLQRYCGCVCVCVCVCLRLQPVGSQRKVTCQWYAAKNEAICLRSICVWWYLAAIVATFTIQAMICPPNVFTWRVHKQIWSYSLYYNDQNV